MIVRLPNGWVVPGELRVGFPEGMELVGKPDGAIGPPNLRQGDDGMWHYRWPTRPPTEEELYYFHNAMVVWTKFTDDAAAKVERRGEIPLEYCEVLKEMFCADCDRERVGVEGDFLCVECRYPT